MFQEAEFLNDSPSFEDKHSLSGVFSMAVFWEKDQAELWFLVLRVLNKFRNTGTRFSSSETPAWVTWATDGDISFLSSTPILQQPSACQVPWRNKMWMEEEKTHKCPIPVFQQKCCTTLKQPYLCFNCWCYIQNQEEKAPYCKTWPDPW